jgi:hypothetical protein
MPTIVLMTEAADLIGFLLIAGGAGVAEGGPQRDCVLTGAPKREDLFHHPLSSVLQAHKNVERQAVLESGPQSTAIRIALANDTALELALGADGRGTWRIVTAAGSSDGLCALAPGRAG